jgi:hypothetical protein
MRVYYASVADFTIVIDEIHVRQDVYLSNNAISYDVGGASRIVRQ